MKKINIVLIFMLIGVFLVQDVSYGLRPPSQFNPLQRESLVAIRGAGINKRIINTKARNLRVLFFIGAPDEKVPARYPVGILSIISSIRSKDFLLKIAKATGRKELPDSIEAFPDIEVKLIDLGLIPEGFDIKGAISGFKPDIVGVSSSSASIDSAYKIAEISEKVCPDALRVIGGIHATALPDEVMNDSRFQIAFSGETEESFAELVLEKAFYHTFDIRTIKGVYYKNEHNETQTTGLREPAINLDDYPSIVDSYDIAHQYEDKTARLYMMRGCPYNCPFCARGIMRKDVRYRSPEKVVKDMAALHGKGFRHIYFIDDTFTLSRKQLIGFLDELEKANLTDMTWTIQTRTDKLLKDKDPDIELIRRMKQLGCRSIQLGIETMDSELSSQIKPGTSQHAAAVTSALNREGIGVVYNLMVGLPGQTWKSIMISMFLIFTERIYFGTSPNLAGVGFAVPYPGSLIHSQKTVRVVKKPDGKSNYPVFASPELFNLAINSAPIGHNFEVPDLVPTETDVMTSQEISEAYFYYQIFIDAVLNSQSLNEIFSKSWVLWHELSIRMAIDAIAEAGDSPGNMTRNEKVTVLRKKMLRGEFQHEFLAGDISMFMAMIQNLSIENGYTQLSGLDRGTLYKFLSMAYSLWMAAPQSFSKIQFALSDVVKEDFLLNKLKNAPEPLDIMKSVLVDWGAFPKVHEHLKEKKVLFANNEGYIDLYGIRFSLDEENKTLMVHLLDINSSDAFIMDIQPRVTSGLVGAINRVLTGRSL